MCTCRSLVVRLYILFAMVLCWLPCTRSFNPSSHVGGLRRLNTALTMARKKNKKAAMTPEFSRVLNVNQVPDSRPVLCRLVAKEKERIGLQERFDLPTIAYFSANVTASRPDASSVLIEGSLEAHIKVAKAAKLHRIRTDFDTMLLDTTGRAGADMKIEESMEYDDEVSVDGTIDIGEIASQYLSLEMGF